MTSGASRTIVLLVEDHADSRQMYAEFLRLDFDVLEASDGIAAMEIAERETPDVVVTDLGLPRMDGAELLRRLRADDRLRDVVVIALSGYAASDASSTVSEGWFDAVLQKPCLPETLAAAIVAALSGRKEGR